MTSYLLAGPVDEPLSLAEAKAFCRVDDDTEDGLIGTLIAAARLHVESVTGKALIAQSWRLVLDCWPPSREIRLPVAPLLSLTAVTAYDEDGEAHEIGLPQFLPETSVAPARLFLPLTIEGEPALRERDAIEIDYLAGYGNDAANVPVDLKQALLMLVAWWFEHRDAAAAGADTPVGFARLIAPYHAVRL